jgi:hypothetical protein
MLHCFTRMPRTREIFAGGEDICDNWVRKLCNNFKKPTGGPGDNSDRIFRCLEIERQIQRKANAAILGVTSGESDHDNDKGSRE